MLQYRGLNDARLSTLTTDCHEKAFVLEDISNL